jgi:diguanylate cyclase (GGDEF)-like protein/hemerythrin-like metal-binding protein/PAS domain S-box-containing protein
MNIRITPLSLRALMLLLVGLLVFVALIFAASELRQSQRTYHDARQLVERNSLAGACLEAVNHFAYERGRSNVILLARETPPAHSRQFLDEKRAAGDKIIGFIFSHLPSEARPAGSELETAWKAVKALRPAVDRDFGLSAEQRDPALPGLWMPAANRLIASFERLLVSISELPDDSDARFARLANLRILALQLRNITGLESSRLAAELLSGHLPERAVINELLELRGRSEQINAQLESGLLRLSDPLSTATLTQVRAAYFGHLHAVQDEIIAAAERGQRAPVSLDQYFESSLSALDSTTALSEAINRLAETYATKRLAEARAEMTGSVLGIAAIILLAVFAALVMATRFTRPLNAVLQRIDGLLRTHSRSLEPVMAAAGHDEFAKLQRALELLDEAIEARWRSENALHASERISASILTCIPQAVITTDLNGLITVFSPGAESLLGYSAAEMVGQQTPLCFHDHEEIRLRAGLLSEKLGRVVEPDFRVFVRLLEIEGPADEQEWTFIRKDGLRLPVLLSVAHMRNAQGGIDGCLGVATDITERKAFENRLLDNAREQTKQNNLLNTLLETIPVGVFMVEAPSGQPLVANDAARLLLGRGTLPDVNAENMASVYAAFRLPARIPYPVDELPLVLGMKGQSSHIDDMMVVGADGVERILEVMGSPVRDGDGLVWASVVSFFDITGRVENTARITRLAYYDALTRLPNRRLFHDRIQMAITQARRDKSRLALMMIDLDRFKPVNDSLGHAVGDLLLKAVAGRMQLCLRESDTLARVGGDEFFVILPGVMNELDAIGVGEKIRQVLNEPFALEGGYQVSIACCVGIAIFPEHGQDEKALASNADEAMYAAKAFGRNCVQVFNGLTEKGSFANQIPGAHPILHLVWHKSYRCGESSIDQEHHALFDMANRLMSAAITTEVNHALVASALEELIASVSQHFINEEAVLARYHYDDLADHALKHQRLLGQTIELRRLAAEGDLCLTDLVLFIAQDVVVRHLLHEDKKFYDFLKVAMKKTRSESKGSERVKKM